VIRTNGQFYWSDALYLARGRDDIFPLEEKQDQTLFQCRTCRAFVLFDAAGGGSWKRLRPFEHHRYEKKYPSSAPPDADRLSVLTQQPRTLCRCKVCASHWWHEGEDWVKADDAMIDRHNV
jgi:hypothetical protein